jgi:DNA-binding CsgD family transcriptional regulator
MILAMTDARDAPVGRDDELQALANYLAAPEPWPRALILEGAAGVGKTTLWQAALQHGEAAGYRVLSCRPAGTEVHLLFGGLADLLSDHAAAVLERLPKPQRRALTSTLLLDDDGGPAADERAVAAGVLGAIRELARDQPVLLAIDDAQWLDPASVIVLEYAIRRLRDDRVAILAARRFDPLSSSDRAGPTEARDGGRGLNLERALEHAPARITVGPLSAGAIHRVLRVRTGQSIPRQLLRRIYEASGGNPFYALEIARAMKTRTGGWATGDPLEMSVSLNELLADRFATLPRATRSALFVASAATSPTEALLEAVIGSHEPELLRPALEAGILRSTRPTIEFTHPLLAAAAAALPDGDERRRWHERLADVATDPEARARHLATARPGPHLEVADQLHAAAQHARSRGAPAAAGELYADAIQRLPEGQLDRRAAWTVEAGPVLRQAGDIPLARALLEGVIDELPAGPTRSDALLALARVVEGEAGGGARELALIDRALDDAGSDPGRRAAALLNREMWTRHQDRLADALAIAREALTFAKLAGDEDLLAGALTRTADLEVLLGLAGDPVAHFERALAAGANLQLDAREDSAKSMLAVCLVRAGRIDEARVLLVQELERVTALGDEASLEILSLFLTELEWLSGDWGRAREHGEAGLLVTEQADSRMMQGATAALVALVEASRGEIEAARDRALDAAALCEEVGDRSYATYAHHILTFIELSAGRAAEAYEHYAAHPFEHGIEGTKRIAFAGDAIEALVQLGRRDEAAALTDKLARRGEELHRPTLSAAAARCRGLVLGMTGEFDEAIAHVKRAGEITERLRLPFERARALLILGDIQRRAKQRATSRMTLESARAAFDELGAPLWSRKAADSLSRIGGRVREEGLTATELRVATLVARGLSNKEIAAELYVTVRAVEANLSRIYAKLEIRSRTELASRL